MLTSDERKRFRSQISCSLCNCRPPVRLYWLPAARQIKARSAVALHVWPIPPRAVLIGAYWPGIRSRDVIGDLEDVLARPPAPVAEKNPAPPAAIAAPKAIPETQWAWAPPPKFNLSGSCPRKPTTKHPWRRGSLAPARRLLETG